MARFSALRSPFPPVNDSQDIFLPIRGDHLLVRATSGGVTLCNGWPKALPPRPEPAHFIGWLAERACRAVHLPILGTGVLAQQGPPGFAFRELRGLHGLLGDGEYTAATTAVELLYWDRTYRLCPSCGKDLSHLCDPHLKRCEPCGLDIEPRAQPSVVVLVYDGMQVLLARPHGLPRDLYTLPAGVVGPGETLEGCLLNLLGRSWPFPDRLMIGMLARADAGELRVDPRLYSEARWWNIDDLPALPPPLSLGRRMADWYAQLPRIAGKPSLAGSKLGVSRR